jgi:hypothetical protein
VDRVGRYFPLTVALPLKTLRPGDAGRLGQRLAHHARCAVGALQDDWPAEQLDQALRGDPDATVQPDTPSPALEQALARVATHPDAALWWLPDLAAEPRFHLTHGLPTGPDFERLFGGSSAGMAG